MTREEFEQLKVGDTVKRIESNGVYRYVITDRHEDGQVAIFPSAGQGIPTWRMKEQTVRWQGATQMELVVP